MPTNNFNVLINSVMLIIVLYGLIKNKYSISYFFIVLSTTIGMFGLQFIGPNIQFSHLIGLYYLPRTFKEIKKKYFNPRKFIKFILSEYFLLIILGLYFGFINPWFDSEYNRPFNQSAPGRTIITLIRELCDIGIILFLFYGYKRKLFDKQLMVKLVVGLLILNTAVAIITYFTPFNIRSVLLGARELPGRFCGFDNEPKHFGKNSVITFCLLMIIYINNQKYPQKKLLVVGMIISFLNIFLSGSTSSISIFAILLSAIIIFKDAKPLNFFISYRYPIFIIALMGAAFFAYFFTRSEYYQFTFKEKVEKVIGVEPEKPIYQEEPNMFRRWEVWDRSAANFLYKNPKFLFLGTGPNLIHIPATRYASERMRKKYKTGLNSVPKMGFLYIIARTGIFGIMIYVFLCAKLLKYARIKGDTESYLIIVILFAFIGLTMDYWFQFLLGYLFFRLSIPRDIDDEY